jgi:hypothetical protein
LVQAKGNARTAKTIISGMVFAKRAEVGVDSKESVVKSLESGVDKLQEDY